MAYDSRFSIDPSYPFARRVASEPRIRAFKNERGCSAHLPRYSAEHYVAWVPLMKRLTRASIVQTALKLLNEVGLDGLTTRSLARELDVKSPALYWHFKNMRDLLDAMAEAMLPTDEWPGPGTPCMTTEEWIAQRAHAQRRALLRYRDGAAIHAGTSPSREGPAGLEARVAALVEYGLSPDDAVRTIMAVARYTVGWVFEEQAHSQRQPRGLGTIDPEAFPALAKAGSALTGKDRDSDFDFGLRALIAGAMKNKQMASTD
jgi:TetR/AcrR family tetracycline transcriptional repressor